jgi:conserved oligomeric Golgi complex subunit 2
MSKFYFAGDCASISSTDDEDNLPYPEALPRSDFLALNFDALVYLSSLSHRHQTLEDLRSDLRERSQTLSKELLDLVNTNYEEFLNLGSDLKGGEEKVQDVRVGLLSFKRGVEDVRAKVKERGLEVEKLLEEKSRVSKHINIGRKLLEVDARLEELEEKLMVGSIGRNEKAPSEESWDDSEDDGGGNERDIHDEGDGGTSLRKLQRLVQDYQYTEQLSTAIGLHHPFIIAQKSRIMRIRNTILLDLGSALKQAYLSSGTSNLVLLRIMSTYREMGEGIEAVKVLRALKV